MKPVAYLTVVETTYHQLVDGQPRGEPLNFRVSLASDEQPFERRVAVTEEAKTLSELGCWIKDVGYLIVRNEQGQRLLQNPTDGEEQSIASAVVEVGSAIVRPGTNCRFEPSSDVTLRCKKGAAICHITVYPK